VGGKEDVFGDLEGKGGDWSATVLAAKIPKRASRRIIMGTV